MTGSCIDPLRDRIIVQPLFGTNSAIARLVSFARPPRRNQPEVHIYDVASGSQPPPCLRLGDSRRSSSRPSEGVLKATYVQTSPSAKSPTTHLLTGGSYGTVRLWRIDPKPKSSRQRQQRQKNDPPPSADVGSLAAKCLWSVPAFGSKGGEGVCEIMVLPSSTSSVDGPLVLLAGDASSLVLLDSSRRTRKAFSTTATPTVAASWDLHRLASRESSGTGPDPPPSEGAAILPARRWTAASRLVLLEHHPECRATTEDGDGDGAVFSRFKIGMVAKCGWIFVAELSVPSGPTRTNQIRTDSIRLRLRVAHRTPRVRCFNSSNEHLASLGGMALQYSLPDVPVPSSSLSRNTLWLGDVEARRYTMPSKDKYVLCDEQHSGTAVPSSRAIASRSTDGTPSSSNTPMRHAGEGLILAHFDDAFVTEEPSSKDGADDPGGERYSSDACILARLPLPSSHQHRGSPLSLAVHPSGEWMVVGYGTNGRGAATANQLELVSMRKRH